MTKRWLLDCPFWAAMVDQTLEHQEMADQATPAPLAQVNFNFKPRTSSYPQLKNKGVVSFLAAALNAVTAIEAMRL